MAIDPQALAVGKCYVTRNAQVRRVTKLEDNRVWYDSRGKRLKKGWSIGVPVRNAPSKESFARSVEREVRCDWEDDWTTL